MLEADPVARAAALLGAASKAASLETKAVYLAFARGLLEAEKERLASVVLLFDAQEAELTRLGAPAPLTPDEARGGKVRNT